MENKIVNNKVIIIISIVLVTIAIIATVVFNYLKPKEKEVAKIDKLEEKNIEQPDSDYIDIEDIEQENGEKLQEQENQNVVNKNAGDVNNNNTKNKMPYYIKVNYGAQVVTIYQKDSEGNYTVPVKAMVCSTGVATPKSGVYSIPARWEWLRLKGYVWGHYSTQITGNILFHSVPYLRKGDPASLEYWEYDKLGTYASAGCIRLMVKDAKWIYNNCAKGTKVEFYSDSNPGPLGKPSAKKISSYPDYLRNWDPTDTNSNNPWLTYKPEEITKPKNEIQNNIANEIKNEIVNEAQNNIANEIKDEIVNEQQNNIVNEIKNEIVNNVVNEVVNEITNTISNSIVNENTNTTVTNKKMKSDKN